MNIPENKTRSRSLAQGIFFILSRILLIFLALGSFGICTLYFFTLRDWRQFPENSLRDLNSSEHLLFYQTFFVLIFLDLIVLGYHQSALKRLIKPSASARSDWLFLIFTLTGIIRLTTLLFSFGVGYYIPILIRRALSINIVIHISSPVLQFIVHLIAYDFLTYWRHRCAHKIPFWWEVHKFHHAALEMNLITSYRVHPLDWAFHHLFVCIPLAILGTPIETYLFFSTFKNFLSGIRHSMVPWDWGWVGRTLLISPIAHRIHHSAQPEHWDKNFGHLSPLWDRLFGSWYYGKIINTEISVNDNYLNQKGVFWDLWESSRRCWRKMF
ncbi:MAG: sterol desaturase family protein [Planctomycetota bacterium]